MKVRLTLLFLAISVFHPHPGYSQSKSFDQTISIKEVQEAQKGWCQALIKISKIHSKSGLSKSKPLASEIIDAAYGYNLGPVAFKPTWANGKTSFRSTRKGAISYFVGDDPAYNDKGFAIGTPSSTRSPWIKCRPENNVIQVFGNTANTMGWVHVEAKKKKKSTVDKTWTFIKDDAGNLRIVLHHSSSPFSGFEGY